MADEERKLDDSTSGNEIREEDRFQYVKEDVSNEKELEKAKANYNENDLGGSGGRPQTSRHVHCYHCGGGFAPFGVGNR